MKPVAPPLKHVIAVLLVTVLALFVRASVQLHLQGDGMDRRIASDMSFFVVPPILALFLFPILRRDRSFLAKRFQRRDLTPRVVIGAVLIALLFRTAWWGQLIARIAFGWQKSQSSTAISGPAISLQCPEPQLLLLGVLVTSVFIPVIEEVTNRGYVQSYLHPGGPFLSIVLASLVFMVFHLYQGWLFALAGGLTLGSLYRVTGSLWAPVICHAIINLTPQITWRCLELTWNPDPMSLPLWAPGLIGMFTFAIAVIAITGIAMALGGCRDT